MLFVTLCVRVQTDAIHSAVFASVLYSIVLPLITEVAFVLTPLFWGFRRSLLSDVRPRFQAGLGAALSLTLVAGFLYRYGRAWWWYWPIVYTLGMWVWIRLNKPAHLPGQ